MPLPELAEVSGPADVVVRFGATPEALAGAHEVSPGVTAAPGIMLIDSPAARFLVSQGREIVVEAYKDAAAKDVRLFLLGSALGAICHQRALLPLHANAVVVDGRAVAFAGPSGAGKSTLAAYFHRRGLPVLCDDVCVVTFDAEGGALAWPGVGRIKLWRDALEAFGESLVGLETVYTLDDKFTLPTPRALPGEPVPLARVCILQVVATGAEAGLRPLPPAEAIAAVVANIYRWEFAAPLGQGATQFASARRLAAHTPVVIAARQAGFETFGAEAERLLADLNG